MQIEGNYQKITKDIITEKIEKIIMFNQEIVELISKEKYESALDYALELLKKAENELEVISFNNFQNKKKSSLEPDTNLNKKLIILIFHNMACVYQKKKDLENCILYLEAVIFHYDGLIKSKYSIIINDECKIEFK